VTTKAPFLSIPAEAELNSNSHHAWVYFPQGLLPSHAHFQMASDMGPSLRPIHECIPVKSNPDTEPAGSADAAPFPGHSLFQESFSVCRIKPLADVPGIRDVYVETVVDGNCGLAFAKVYPSRNPMNGTDILRDRVFPFYERYGVTVRKIATRSTRQYCGLPPVHAFETLLSTSHVEHACIDSRWGMRNQPCEDFYRILCAEFFTPAIRGNTYVSFGKLQQDLDAFLEKYNHDRPYFYRSSQKLTPFALFTDALGLSIAGEQEAKVSRGGV
jgi:hypothetical protein